MATILFQRCIRFPVRRKKITKMAEGMEVEAPQTSSSSVRDKKRFEVKKVRLV